MTNTNITRNEHSTNIPYQQTKKTINITHHWSPTHQKCSLLPVEAADDDQTVGREGREKERQLINNWSECVEKEASWETKTKRSHSSIKGKKLSDTIQNWKNETNKWTNLSSCNWSSFQSSMLLPIVHHHRHCCTLKRSEFRGN